MGDACGDSPPGSPPFPCASCHRAAERRQHSPGPSPACLDLKPEEVGQCVGVSIPPLPEACDPPLQLQDWRARGDLTLLVIAHRLQTVRDADQVLVLRQGQLVDRAELLEGQDLYSLLVQQLED